MLSRSGGQGTNTDAACSSPLGASLNFRGSRYRWNATSTRGPGTRRGETSAGIQPLARSGAWTQAGMHMGPGTQVGRGRSRARQRRARARGAASEDL